MQRMPFEIITPKTAGEWRQARVLVEEYITSLGIDLSFQNIDKELEDMSVEYDGARGAFYLAKCDGRMVGCVGIRPLEGDVCEMKRLYVSSEGRGNGIGTALVQMAIEEAKRIKYSKILLDTLSNMHAARSIYKNFGFEESEAYYNNPLDGAVYLQLLL